MLTRKRYKRFLTLAITLFCLFSFPALFVTKMRAKTHAFFSPLWHKKARLGGTSEIQKKLEVENTALKQKLKRTYALLSQQTVLESASFLSELIAQATPAKVIYRDPAQFASSLWIDVGEETNAKLGRRVVAKNSPVIVGHSVVGAVDFVEKKQARVRLISDAGLFVSCRAARGSAKSAYLLDKIDPLLRHIAYASTNELSAPQRQELSSLLNQLKTTLLTQADGWYLAKGTLEGAVTPLWRKGGVLLQGKGFNYDFDDCYGKGRPLISDEGPPLLQVGDLLVTTGMDGIFPEGLHVAEVSEIEPLKEGDYTYSLLAVASAFSLEELTTLFVMPPLAD